MFASLKSKIKEETGSDVAANTRSTNHNNNRVRSRVSSISSISESDQLSALRSQCSELYTKVTDLTARLQTLQEEKIRVEKTNEILLETVKVAQTQKDIYCEENEKIQNIQLHEIEKLKNLLSFREQEAVDRLASIRQNEQQISNLMSEVERLKQFEHVVDDLQDELERLQHSSQLGKNNLTTTLAAVEEENRHLKMRLEIVEQSRLEALSTLNASEKIQAFVQEHKLLKQHLEEAHLQLSDIKSSWSGQNLALETQVSRLSKQVAEETTEKRKIQKQRDDLAEKVKSLQFEMLKLQAEIEQRNDKIKLLEEEIDDLNSTLKECREEAEQQILFERNKVHTLETETKELKARLAATDARFSECVANNEHITQTLREQNTQLQQQLEETLIALDAEREEKLTALLRNAEISQSEELLRQELRIERSETTEQHNLLQADCQAKLQEISEQKITIDALQRDVASNAEKLQLIEEMEREAFEKNKTIKMLNQRLADLKKTLQTEFRNSKPFELVEKCIENGSVPAATDKSPCYNITPGGSIVMDEVNFKYLKHVIVKFLTSREVEAVHLIRAVATLLKLSKEEEKLLHDTLNWKMSWFGFSKPDHGTGQHAFSIPPS